MTKFKLRKEQMNKNMPLLFCLFSILAVSGCSCFESWGGANTYLDNSAPKRYSNTNPAPAPMSLSQSAVSEKTVTAQSADDGFVQYTETVADYREFGERTPRDQYIVQGGAGSNMSAAIPPAIDEEVADYEEEIRITEENSAGSENDYAANGEDPTEDWLAEEGQTLKGLLSNWSERAGWRLIWKTNRNYTLTAGAMFRGRFADVSSALVRAFARARPAPVATFYKGNRVLVVETLEDENAFN